MLADFMFVIPQTQVVAHEIVLTIEKPRCIGTSFYSIDQNCKLSEIVPVVPKKPKVDDPDRTAVIHNGRRKLTRLERRAEKKGNKKGPKTKGKGGREKRW